MALRLPTLTTALRVDRKDFNAAMDQATAKVIQFGQRIGPTSVAVAGLGVALGAAAIAGTKMAIEFDREMTRIETLVGVNRKLVSQWREDLLNLAGVAGVGPSELARSLFVVTSAGERTQNALNIVERAAKLSAIGLGDTATVARSLTAVMNAYGAANLSAARAADILLGIVREGNFAAEELAPTLGRIVAVAEQAGVSFEELGTFIATFTRLGVPVDEAITSLRGFLLIALKKTDEQSKRSAAALATVGLSADKLRASIREKGLLATLQLLGDTLKDNPELLGQIIPRVRALAGVMAQFGEQADDAVVILDRLKSGFADVDKEFERVLQTPAQNLRQLKAQFEAAGIALGQTFIPVLSQLFRIMIPVIRGLQDIAAGFAALPPIVSAGTVALLGLIAVAVPLISIIARLVVPVVTMQAAAAGTAVTVKLMTEAVASAAAPVLGLAAAIGVVLLNMGRMRRQQREAAADFAAWEQQMTELSFVHTDLAEEIQKVIDKRRALRNLESGASEEELATQRAKVADFRRSLDRIKETTTGEQQRDIFGQMAAASARNLTSISAEIADLEAELVDLNVVLAGTERTGAGKVVQDLGFEELANVIANTLDPRVRQVGKSLQELKRRQSLVAEQTELLNSELNTLGGGPNQDVIDMFNANLAELESQSGSTKEGVDELQKRIDSFIGSLEQANIAAEQQFITLDEGVIAALRAHPTYLLMSEAEREFAEATVLSTQRLEEQTAALQKAKDVAEDNREAIAGITGELRDQNVKLQLTAEGWLRYQLAAKGASEETIEAAVAQMRANEELQKANDTFDEAVRRFEDFKQSRIDQELFNIQDAAFAMGQAVEDAFAIAITSFDDLKQSGINMVDTILEEMQRLVLRMLVLQPIIDAMTKGLGSLFGVDTGPLFPVDPRTGADPRFPNGDPRTGDLGQLRVPAMIIDPPSLSIPSGTTPPFIPQDAAPPVDITPMGAALVGQEVATAMAPDIGGQTAVMEQVAAQQSLPIQVSDVQTVASQQSVEQGLARVESAVQSSGGAAGGGGGGFVGGVLSQAGGILKNVGIGLAIGVGVGFIRGLLSGDKDKDERERRTPGAPDQPIIATLPEEAIDEFNRRRGLTQSDPFRAGMLSFNGAMVPGAGMPSDRMPNAEAVDRMISSAVARQAGTTVVNIKNELSAVDQAGMDRVADRMTPRMLTNIQKAMQDSRTRQRGLFE